MYAGVVPQLRTAPTHQVDTAIEDLRTVGSSARGIDIERSTNGQVTITVNRHRWSASVITRDSISKRDAAELVATGGQGSTIVVANRLSTEAKDLLEQANEGGADFRWSWLDRRGDLHLNHPKGSGVINFDTTTLRRGSSARGRTGLASPRSDGPIRGRAGISYASALLRDPTAHPSIRAVAAEADMSHGAVGDASKLLRDEGLMMESGAPQTPELFWALADAWGPTRVTPVAAVPTRDQAMRLRANANNLDEPGWAVGGDTAAAAWGAPVFAAQDRPWIWVPSEADARRAERALGLTTWDDHAAVIAVVPTRVVACHRVTSPIPVVPDFLPTIHPLFLALELAQDSSRGHEILDGWTPEHSEIIRVW